MIDSKYGLKYSFPHTLVHIVDNSAYAGETAVTETYDPSLFATIVVTGMPMGVDNRITTVTRSDVLNKAFGADTLTTADIQKYGQAVEYPAALLRQNAPVRLLRVTPTDAKFAVAVLYIEWRVSNDGKTIEVRLEEADETDLTTTAIDLSAFANTERLAKATFSRLPKTGEDNNGWQREVLITYVSAGRGSAYNDYAVYINQPTYDQRKKYKNAIYQFGTIDTRTNSTVSSDYVNELEAFTASLINDATKLSTYGITNTMDTVNTQMKKRLEGSSIMIPYVNESAIKKLYTQWHDFFKTKLNESADNIEESRRVVYEYLLKTLDVNLFDCIFGKTIYNDNVIDIPYLQIDALDPDVPLADKDKIYIVYEPATETRNVYIYTAASGAVDSTVTYYRYTGIETITSPYETSDTSLFTAVTETPESTDGLYTRAQKTEPTGATLVTFEKVTFDSSDADWSTGQVILTYYKYIGTNATPTAAELSDETKFTKVNPTEDVFDDTKDKVYTKTETPETAVVTEDIAITQSFDSDHQLSENRTKIIDTIYEEGLREWIQELYDVEDEDKPETIVTTDSGIVKYKQNTYSGYASTSVVPGSMYLYNADTQPVFQIVTSINSYTGTLSTATIPNVYHIKQETVTDTSTDPATETTTVVFDKTAASSMVKKYFYCNDRKNPSNSDMLDFVRTRISATSYRGLVASVKNDEGEYTSYGSIIAVGYDYTSSDNKTTVKKFKLFQVESIENNNVSGWIEYPTNYYAALDYTSHYSAEGIHGIVALVSKVGENLTDVDEDHIEAVFTATATDSKAADPGAFAKIGALIIDDVSPECVVKVPTTITGDQSETLTAIEDTYDITRIILNTTTTTEYPSGLTKNTVDILAMDCFTENNFRVGTPPSSITIPSDVIGSFYDVAHVGNTAYESDTYANEKYKEIAYLTDHASDDDIIYRYQITGTALSVFKLAYTNITIPNNYYSSDYGINPISEQGGISITGGYSGFFDDYDNGDISSIEFKLKYSELLVKAFRGEIDSRILSPVRVPAKFMFDAGYNCVLGIKSLPYSEPSVEDIILASTIFTDDEKEEYAYDNSIIKTRIQYNSVDVKQAMYDLMIERCYQRIPEDKRPIGPGSGFQLYLDTGFSDNINTIKKIIETFRTKFTNPNASMDIGGYTSALNGVTYTYTKRVVDNLFRHCQQYTINKPFANTYATIPAAEVVEFFPNIDTTDWDLEELMYTSGGNSWVLDTQGNLRRKSQKTMYNESTGTSDLLQESNMRTLSQLIYLLQNQIDNWLLEYVDDGILTSMTESINNIFSGWVGTRVEALDIRFEKDINTDGGEIVVCYVNVVFRGLLLRVPIIVNVNRRES